MLESEVMTGKTPHPTSALGRKRQLLVVDDNQAVQEVMSEMLSFLGYDVTLAGNGIQPGKRRAIPPAAYR